jgi:hypothetical protein
MTERRPGKSYQNVKQTGVSGFILIRRGVILNYLQQLYPFYLPPYLLFFKLHSTSSLQYRWPISTKVHEPGTKPAV